MFSLVEKIQAKNNMKKLMFLMMAFGMFFTVAGNVSAQTDIFGFNQTAVFQNWNYQGNFTFSDIEQETASSSEANAVGTEQKLCSKGGGKKMNISWKNNTKMTLRINWVNFKCVEEKNDRQIKPGQVYDGVSYVGHWFIIRDFNSNKKLGRREVKAQYANMGIPK